MVVKAKSLFKNAISLLSVAVLFCGCVWSQNLDTLRYLGHAVLPNDLTISNTVVGELSGVEYSGKGNLFYLMPQCRGNAHYYTATIDWSDGKLNVAISDVKFLKADTLEGESVRSRPGQGEIYVTDERKNRTSVYAIDSDGSLKTILHYDKNLRKNKGFEGLCFDEDGKNMFIAIENTPVEDTTRILTYNFSSHAVREWYYPLDRIENDAWKNNGITEILWWQNQTILVLERPYIKADDKVSARVYEVTLPESGKALAKTRLLTDFSDVPIKMDNLEGMAYMPGKKEILFVSDNNSKNDQQTQFILMKLE